ncbi:MAG: DUF4252 domain-containing protein [Ferruginibacter sp.]
MKKTLLLMMTLGSLLLLQSCLISREPQNDLRNMDIRDVYDVRTVRVPMIIARPVVQAHLKSEDCSKELRRYVKRIKAVRVTLAVTRPGFDMPALRAMATKAPYEEWMSVNAHGSLVYINAAQKNNSIRKINVLVAAKDNALVYAMIKCNLSPEELSRFISLALSNDKAVTGLMEEIGNNEVIKAL